MKPAYVKVYDDLKKSIIDGEIAVHEFLPPEPALEQQFRVSRTTIRRAIELLAREGFVLVKQGRGTQVLDHKARQNLNYVTSISETLKQKGYEISSKNMFIDYFPATVSLAESLGVQPGDPLVRIQRIQQAGGVPFAIMRNYLVPENVPGILACVNQFASLYEFLEEQYKIVIDSVHDSISARTADFAESSMLNVPLGTAILYISRVSFSGGKPVCADRVSILGEKYELEINTTGRHKLNE